MVLDILKECKVEGLVVKLPEGQLERKLYTDVKNKLELIGGKWKGGKTQGFVFEEDPAELLEAVANGDDRNLKKEHQFFPTPIDIAEQMISYLPTIGESMKILEPSAGDGALVKALHAAHPEIIVDCFETMELNRKKLSKVSNVILIGEDFLQCDLKDTYDIIIANPPFTKNQDIDHILKMYECLKPGGTIITLASPSWTFGSQKRQNDFKQWLEDLDVYPVTLPQKSFVASGTAITPVLLQIQKPITKQEPVHEITDANVVEEKPVRYSDEELGEFKEIVLGKLVTANSELKFLEGKIGLMTKDTDKEQYQQLAERQKIFIAHLNDALARIEDKTYGICRVTGNLIDKQRLRAVPHATLSAEAKKAAVNSPQESEAVQLPVAELKEEKIRTCRECGCTDNDCRQCIKKTGKPCHWVEEDLCSACQIPDPEVILDRLAENETQIQQGIKNLRKLISPNNKNVMNFFQQLNEVAPGIELNITLKEKNGKYTTCILPQVGSRTNIQPLLVTGTPAELDEKFFDLIRIPLQETGATIKNAEEHKKSLAADAKKDTAAKPVTKTAEKKTAAKKEGKVPKKVVSKNEKNIVETDMFASSVEPAAQTESVQEKETADTES